MNKVLKSLLLFCIILCNNGVHAAHIVGGVVYYEYLGNNNYKIIFEIYRDCSVATPFDGLSTGGPNAYPFYFGIFEGNSATNLYSSNNSLFNPDTLSISSVYTNQCIDPDGTCVQKGRYEVTVNLPKNNVGYTIIHQRCCRNTGILNLENIAGGNDKPGITISAYIPPIATYQNNSARFKKFPPIFICNNEQFYFDHSATDVDGDQLRYFLATPNNGLSAGFPTSQIQSTNYSPCIWQAPYSQSNMLGGSPALSIDSVSGLLSCKPNTAGRFVVAIMIKEIRNGVVIDSFIRDFQFNVRDCVNKPKSDLPMTSFNPQTNSGFYGLFCQSSTVKFTNTSTNYDSCVWKFGDPASGANNISQAVSPSHTFSDSGTFKITLLTYKKFGTTQICIDSVYAIVKVYPTLTAKFVAPSGCIGSTVNFTNNSNSTSGTINGWSWDFGNGATSTVQNPSYTYTNTGTYNVKLIVTDNKTCQDDTTIQVVIYPKPTIGATINKACLGQPLSLQCNVTIAAPSTIAQYKWTLPDGSVINNCNATLVPTSSANGTVKLWAISDKGCADSQQFTYVVYPLPIVKASNDTAICYDGSATLQVAGAITYQWTPATYLSTTTGSTVVSTPAYPNPIPYYVEGTDANGCKNFDTVLVSFHTKPFISAGLDTSVCLEKSSISYRDSVQLNGQGTFSTVYWQPITGLDNPNTLKPKAKPKVTTDYVLFGVDAFQCLIKDTVNVFVLDPSLDLISTKEVSLCKYDTVTVTPLDQGIITSYRWTPTFWMSNPIIREPRFYPLDTTIYILTVQNYCYQKSDSILLSVKKLPEPGLPDVDSICLGDTYRFRLPSGWISYNWTTTDASISDRTISNPTVKPSLTQYYKVDVVGSNQCKNSDSMRLLVNYPPSITLLGIKRYICRGDTIPIRALTSTPALLKWRDARYLNTDTGYFVKAYPTDTTKFYITATSGANCSQTDSFVLNVQKPIFPYAKSPLRICKGKYISMKAEGGLYYLWKPNYNILDTNVSNPQVFPDSTVTYKVYISNDCFVDSLPVDVYVDSLPRVTILSDTTTFRGTPATMTAITSENNFNWDPKSEIETPFAKTVSLSPMHTTNVSIQVSNARGCIGVDTAVVTVFGNTILLLPSGFSPNGDGHNDVFHIVKYLNIKTLNAFEVYNRWGELVFRAKNVKDGWDGTFNGEPVQNGIYTWKIDIITYDNIREVQSGETTLIR